MNAFNPRFFKSVYRKEPISSFILIVGAVDIVIGGFNTRWSLLTFGVTLMLIAAALRWVSGQKNQEEMEEETAKYFLTGDSSRPPLPLLTPAKHRR